jgi:hypothetical protein
MSAARRRLVLASAAAAILAAVLLRPGAGTPAHAATGCVIPDNATLWRNATWLANETVQVGVERVGDAVTASFGEPNKEDPHAQLARGGDSGAPSTPAPAAVPAPASAPSR